MTIRGNGNACCKFRLIVPSVMEGVFSPGWGHQAALVISSAGIFFQVTFEYCRLLSSNFLLLPVGTLAMNFAIVLVFPNSFAMKLVS